MVNSYATGAVEAGGAAGGLIGDPTSASIYNSYANWSVRPKSNNSSCSPSGPGGALTYYETSDAGFVFNENNKCENKFTDGFDTYTCHTGGNLSDIVTIQNGGDNSGWDSTIWDNLGTARPTLKNSPTF